VEDFAHEGKITVISGQFESGKSLQILGLAIAVSEGRSYFGQQIKLRPVVYLDHENGEDTIEKRLKFYEASIANPNLLYWDLASSRPEVDDPAILEWIDEKMASGSPAPMVIIDTLRTFLAGGNVKEEKDVTAFFEKLKPYKALGCSVVVLCHSSSKTESAKMFPGSDAIPGSADFMYCVTRKDRKSDIIKELELFRFKGRDVSEVIPRTSKAVLSPDGQWKLGSIKVGESVTDLVESGIQPVEDAQAAMFAIIAGAAEGINTRAFIKACAALDMPIHKNVLALSVSQEPSQSRELEEV
jgi:hypothetical protein